MTSRPVILDMKVLELDQSSNAMITIINATVARFGDPTTTSHSPETPPIRLVPEPLPRGELFHLLSELTPDFAVPRAKSIADAISLIAGLYLVHDFLDEGHNLAQEAEDAGATRTAPYWHGIMHRREPDYDNARYWFRRVGDHPIFPEIGREIGELLSEKEFAARLRFPRVLDRRGHWDAMAFIDLCEWCGTAWDERAQAAARLQEVEIRLLLEYTCRAAQGA